MITIIVAITLWAFILVWNNRDWIDGFGDLLFHLFFGWLCGLSIWMIIWFILPMDLYWKESSLEIVNLQDNSSVEGRSFFLWSWYINGTMNYIFYYEKDWLYSMMKVEYDKAQIKYTEWKPKVNISEQYPTGNHINLFALDIPADNKYIIEVPKGTIKTNYNLDAQ